MPAGPYGWLPFGHIYQLLNATAWNLLSEWVLQQPPLVKVNVLQRKMVLVGTPQGMKEVYQTKFRLFHKDTDFSFAPYLPILGTGLVTARGEQWQKQRLLMAPTLRVDILDSVIRLTHEAVERLSVKLEAAKASRQPIEMEEEFRLLTLQIIGGAVLSLPPDECDRVFPQLYLPVMAEGYKRSLQPWRMYIPTQTWFQHRSRINQLNAYVKGRLRERWSARQEGKREGEHKDIVDLLMAATEAQGESWSSGLEDQLCYEVKTLLLAGHETSAALLTWTLHELCENPDSLGKVQQEAKEMLATANAKGLPQKEAVEGMQYTLCALKESLRKYSVVPVVTRRVEQDTTLCGMQIPVGAYLAILIQAVHQSWQKHDQWRPERFLPGDEFDQFPDDIRPYMFVPFGQGPRNCIGQYFSLLEARLVMGMLWTRFKFQRHGAPPQRNETVIPTGTADGLYMMIS
ncbi:hypothetical protein WJX73_006540 [Symbiochloris irregularis]|uniref:Cytochrome P450 n=1 Tax=Symbiochloris irregularis TaxID=706552 RepID=A0AAW1NRD5_9CHLO